MRDYLAARSTFPSLTQFDLDGRADLRSAIVDHGGVPYWAYRLGLPVAPGRDRLPYTDEDAIIDATRVIVTVGYLPSEPTLRTLGYHRLATAVRVAGGAATFCRKHKLDTPNGDSLQRPTGGRIHRGRPKPRS